MAYVEEICLALVRTLEHATFHKGVRLAGYAANAKFWADEVRHVLDCLAGYESRFNNLKNARTQEAEKLRVEVEPAWVTPTLTTGEIDELQKRLKAAATAFMRGCAPHIEHSEVLELEQLLGIRIQNRRPLD